jgi:hypothetical protein
MTIVYQNVILGNGPVGRIAALNKSLTSSENILVLDAGTHLDKLITRISVDSNINYISHSTAPSLVDPAKSVWYGAIQDLSIKEYVEFSYQFMSPDMIMDARNRVIEYLAIRNFDFESNLPNRDFGFGSLMPFAVDKHINQFSKVIKDPYLRKINRHLRSDGKIQIRLNSVVTKLIPKDKYIEIEYVDANNNLQYLLANKVYIALGTIETTRLLLNSQTSSKVFQNRWLGHNLSDHLSLNLGTHKTLHMNRVLSLFARRRSSDGNLLWPRLQLADNKDTERSRSFVHATHFRFSKETNNLFYKFLRRYKLENLYIKKQMNGEFRLYISVEKENNFKNRIEIVSGDSNPIPMIQIYFGVSEGEMKRILDLATTYIDHLSSLGIIEEGFFVDHIGKNLASYVIETASHPSGTYRMSSAPNQGVVDSSSRLWLDPRIRLLGAGTFPRAFSIHPTFPSMLLAILASRD